MKQNSSFNDVLTLDNLKKCYNEVRSTCRNRRKLYRFEINLNTNLENIYRTLKKGTYEPYPYSIFLVHEPKSRVVMSQEVGDKVVNHFMTDYIIRPYLDPLLIDQNVATRKGKGTKEARRYIEKYLNILNLSGQEIYCLKLDIHHYFYSIDQELLLQMLRKDIKDSDAVNIISKIIRETNKKYVNEMIDNLELNSADKVPRYKYGKGLSIGAVVSQMLAIYYMNSLDHYIKEQLKCKYYIRYQDDMCLLSTDKAYLMNCYKNINIFVEKLKLVLNPKSNLYKLSRGINFLDANYRVIGKRLIIKPKKQTYKKVKDKLHRCSIQDLIKYYRSCASYHGYFKRFNIIEKVSKYSMENIDQYNAIKKDFKNYIVIIRSKNFYYTFLDDAIILHYLLGYKLSDDKCVFGENAYANVSDSLHNHDISYIIYDNKLLINKGIDDIYDNILLMSKKHLEKEDTRNELWDLLNDIIDNNYKDVSKIKKYLEELNKKNTNIEDYHFG